MMKLVGKCKETTTIFEINYTFPMGRMPVKKKILRNLEERENNQKKEEEDPLNGFKPSEKRVERTFH